MNAPRQIPLKVVPDEIASPPGTTRIPFGGGIVQLGNGSQFQIASGSITVTFDTSGAVISSTPVQELMDELDRLTRQGQFARDAFCSAIRNGLLGPAEPAKRDKPG